MKRGGEWPDRPSRPQRTWPWRYISLKYQGIDLTYGMSIDYLAYRKISRYGLQRGCTILELNEDASYQIHQENYYQDKYVSKLPKENVNLVDYYNK